MICARACGSLSSLAERHGRGAGRRGTVLLIVLVLVVMLALAGYTFCELTLVHRRATRLHGRQFQARLLAESGVVALRQALVRDEVTRQAEGGLHDNPTRFRGVVVLRSEDPETRGGFSVVAPALGERGEYAGVRFGVADESARLNINAPLAADAFQDGAGRQMLMALPGMTEATADAILDWLDPDDVQRPFGAETAYYAALNPPYACKNGPLDALEELLLVRGVTPALLFGRDGNRNYLLDAGERQTAPGGPALHAADRNPCGWAAYLTLYGSKPNQGPREGRAYVNEDDLPKLYDEMLKVFGNNRQWAMFVVAYRQNGPFNGLSTLDSATNRELELGDPPRFYIRHPLDLVGCNVQVTLAGDSEPVVLASPFTEDQAADYFLPELNQKLAVYNSPTIPAGIDLMKAPAPVLRTIPGISDRIAAEILARRNRASRTEPYPPLDELWLLEEGIVSLDEMRAIIPHITTGGHIYRAQVVGYFHDGGPSSRVEVVVDAGRSPPQLLLWKDLSHLTRGYSLDLLGVQ